MKKQIYSKMEGYDRNHYTFWLMERETEANIWFRQIGNWYSQDDENWNCVTCPNEDIVTENIERVKKRIHPRTGEIYYSSFSEFTEGGYCLETTGYTYAKNTNANFVYKRDFPLDSMTYSAWVGEENIGAVRFNKEEAIV